MVIVYGVNRKTILRKVAKDTRHREESYREIFRFFSDGNTGYLYDLYL